MGYLGRLKAFERPGGLGSGMDTGAGAGAGADTGAPTACEKSEKSEKSPPGGACPRCARLEAQVAEVLEQLRAHPALPPALRALPPERLSILVRWAIVSLSNPRPQWPPPRTTDAQRTHRAGLADIIAGLGGRGDDLPFEGTENEAEAEDWLFLDDDAEVH